MKKNNVLKISLSLLVVLLYACNKYDDCDAILPEVPQATIKIMDQNGSSLIGENNVYDPSVIKFYSNTDTIPFQPSENGDPIVLFFNYGPMKSDVDYYLSLNETETDTLNFSFITTETTCFDLKDIEEVKINGTTSKESSDDLIIILKNNAAKAEQY